MKAATTLASALAGLAAAALVHAQGSDELWNMTTRMEMDGMQMPPMSQQVCQKKGQGGAAPAPDPKCTTSDVRTAGNKTSWKMSCTGDEPMSGTGEITRTRDSMSGRMQLRGKDGVAMNVVYSGKLAGTCNAQAHQDPQQAALKQKMAAMQAQGDAQSAQMCKESIENFSTAVFEMQNAPCAPRKGEYCAHVKKTAQAMRTPAGYRKAMQIDGLKHDGWENAARFCGVQAAPVLAAACKSAVGGRDWQFVADFCPAESRKIAAEQCAGREYTVAMSSEYKAICGKQKSGFAQPARAAAQPAASAAPSAGDAVKEGARALKNLFGR